MKHLLFLATIATTTLAGATNLVLNGDFESNSAGSTTYNVANATYNSLMSNSTAFGTAQEIDIVRDADYGPAVISGRWKANLHKQTNGNFDALSLDLSSALSSGSTYTLTFLAAYSSSQPGSVEVGVSSSSTTFGTQIYSATPGTTWTLYTHSFTGVSGSYLTVRAAGGYMNVDAFTIDAAPVPEPFTMGLAGLALATAARRRLRKSA